MNYNVCKNLEEVKKETSNLDIASLCPLKIVDNGVDKEVNNRLGVYNISQGCFCAAVVNHYNLIQHKEYFNNFAEALERLKIPYAMEIKQSGNRAFADITFVDKNIKFDKLNEEFMTGIRLANSYDKSLGLLVATRYTRLACTNGMIITRNEKVVSIKHHFKIVNDIEKIIEQKINNIINSSNKLQLLVSSSMKDSTEWMNACKIIEKLFSQIKHREEILKRLNISLVEITDKKTTKKSISYVNNKNNKKFTRWELYNAITNYLTYGEQITPHIENLFHKKAELLLTTQLSKMPIKQKVLNV